MATLAASDGLTERQIEEDVNLPFGQIGKVLKYLSVESPAPVLKDGPHWRRTPITYQLDRARIERLTQQRGREWQEIQAYIDQNQVPEELTHPDSRPDG